MSLQLKITLVFSFLVAVILMVIAAGVSKNLTISGRFDLFSDKATAVLHNLGNLRVSFEQQDNYVLEHYLTRSPKKQRELEAKLETDLKTSFDLAGMVIEDAQLVFAENKTAMGFNRDLESQRELLLLNRRTLDLSLKLEQHRDQFMRVFTSAEEKIQLRLLNLNDQSSVWISSIIAVDKGLKRIRELTEMVQTTEDPEVYPTLTPTASDTLITLKANLDVLEYQNYFFIKDLRADIDTIEKLLVSEDGLLPTAVSFLQTRDLQKKQLEKYQIDRRKDLENIDKFSTWLEQNIAASANKTRAENSSAIVWLVTFGTVVVVITMLVSFGMVQGIRRPLKHLTEYSRLLSRGDLTRRFDKLARDEFGTIGNMLNDVAAHLNNLVSEVMHAIGGIHSASDNLLTNNQKSLQRVSRIGSEIETLSAALQELGTSAVHIEAHTRDTQKEVDTIHQRIAQSSGLSKQNADKLAVLGSQMRETSGLVRSVRKSSEDINSVVAIIRAVAQQTNLLALNAAIEAARAGEEGRGFAVVADEVRELAARTQKSTEEIQDIVSSLQAQSRVAEEMVENSAESTNERIRDAQLLSEDMNAIGDGANIIKDMSAMIASSALEQGTVIQDVAKNIVLLADQLSENQGEFNDNVAQTQDLAQRAHGLQRLTSTFITQG